ncbi:1689_t:CDS:2 [Cetraspora pellucida]|uniref:1689_t:CDS:1 n=1 Tax=Cetraspora pellucida TaxID=1433469 RepID=A0A9N8ZHS3_9GLOM|nr:1689_t:CDS:2 [Cetraspora pellucida]
MYLPKKFETIYLSRRLSREYRIPALLETKKKIGFSRTKR